MKIKSIEVIYLNEEGLRIETHKTTAKTYIEIDPKRKLITQLKKFSGTRTERKWTMIAKMKDGAWYIFNNKG